jgi:hypothetical protein
MSLKLPSGFSRVAASNGIAASYGDWEKRLPNLCGFLCDLSWADGTTKRTGKVTLWTDDGLWKGCLSLPDPAVVAFLSAQDPSGLLQLMERQLRDDNVDWRRSRPFSRNGTQRHGRSAAP